MSFKTYIFSVVTGGMMLLGAPILLFVIFMSGDSCCGENTSGNIALVTGVISILTLLTSLGLNVVGSLFVKKKKPEFNFLKGTLLTWLISSGIYWLFAGAIMLTAF